MTHGKYIRTSPTSYARALRYITLVVALVFCFEEFPRGSLLGGATGTWVPAGSMAGARTGAASILLKDLRLLVIGGERAGSLLSSSEFFYSDDGTFAPAGAMNAARRGHVAVLLQDGRVLVAGGQTPEEIPTNTAEIYDPVTDAWTFTGSMIDARAGATATLLGDGRVLIAGGENAGGILATLEIFDPATGTFSDAGRLVPGRKDHAAAVLPDGKVLIIGGTDGQGVLTSVEMYDPETGSVSPGPELSVARAGHTATTLLDGTVAVIGGTSGSNELASAEVYDPAVGSFVLATGGLGAARRGHLAFLLPYNNNVLIVGGTTNGAPLASAELYVPWKRAFQPTGWLATARAGATGSALPVDGLLVTAGGTSTGDRHLSSSELYSFATVKTDQDDYIPGATVTITGRGWEPGETVSLRLHETIQPPIHDDILFETVADANGNIVDTSFMPDEHDLGVRFMLTAGGRSSEALWTFTDGPPATIIVEKQTLPEGSTESFFFTGAVGGIVFDNGTITAGNLPSDRTYTSTEDPTPGWTLTSIVCNDSDSTGDVAQRKATFRVSAGETVKCTFTNTQSGSIVVVKDAVPNSAQDFSFATGGGLSPATFDLDDDAGAVGESSVLSNSRTFSDLMPGSYSVSEMGLPAGWELSGSSCVSSIGDGEDANNLELDPGETITCTFTNTRPATVTVTKTAVGGDASFSFSGNLGLASLTTTGGTATQSFTFSSLPIGGVTRTVTELAGPAGWDFTSLSCVDPDGGSQVVGATGTLDIDPGEAIACTFTNTKRGTIRVVKNTVGGDGTFSFASSFGLSTLTTTGGTGIFTSASLAPGAGYSVSEIVPSGWDLTSSVCSSGTAANVIVAPGAQTTCTFTNTKRATVVVEKHTVGGEGSFAFTSTGITPGTFWLTTAGGTATQTFGNLLPGGSVSVSEFAPVADITMQATPIAFITAPLGGGNHDIEVIRDGVYPVLETAVPSQQYDTWTGDATRPIDWIGYSFSSAHTFTGLDFQEGGQFVDGGFFTTMGVQVRSGGVWSDVANLSVVPIYPLGNGLGFERFTLTFTPVDGDAIRVIGTPGGSAHFISVGELRVWANESDQPTLASPGWDLTSATCSDGSPVTAIALSPGEVVTCTFTNTKRGTIAIVQDTVPDDAQDFTFTTTGLTPGSFVLDDDGDAGNGTSNTRLFHVAPGSYSVTESGVPGFDLSALACVTSGAGTSATSVPASALATVSLGAGGTATCTFTNTRRGTIRVVKNTVGGDGTFGFTSSFGLSTLTTTGGTASFTSAGLVPGSGYNVSETVPAGWDLTSAVCSSGTPANVNVAPGAETLCTFTNTKRATLVVEKHTVGGDGTFPFSTTGLTPASFNLTTTAGAAAQTFNNVVPGNGYAVSETAQAGWDLTSATCSDGSPISAIDLSPGEVLTCSFTNTKRGTIRVVKNTLGGDGTFGFTSTFGLTTLTTSGGTASFTSASLAPGSGYSVSETVPAGWDLTSAVCSSGTIGDVVVAPGAETTCTFTNTKRGTITIVKDTVPDHAQDFSFTGNGPGGFTFDGGFSLDDDGASDPTLPNTRTFIDLVPGSYSVQEAAVQGFDLTAVECVATGAGTTATGTPQSGTAAITLGAGGAVTCTYRNRQRGTLTILEDTLPNDPQDFGFTGSGPGTFAFGGGFFLDDDANPALSNTTTFGNVVPGAYILNEAGVGGFDTVVACVDPDGQTTTLGATAIIDIDPGEVVTCSFTNTKRATLVVEKHTVGGDGTFAFTTTGLSPGNFSLTTDFGVATQTFGNLLPGGSFSVAETAPVEDITAQATPIAFITAPLGGGNHDIEVIRDGIFPPAGTPDPSQQYDTWTGDATRPIDWIGYSFSAAHTFTGLDLQEGGQFVDGGFFTTMGVQVRSGGVWSDVANLSVVPIYPLGNGLGFERFTLTFTPVSGDAIRVIGTPGGSAHFISVAELRVWADEPDGPTSATAAWDLSSATCSDGSPLTAIALSPGEVVTCSFTNTKRGTIAIVQDTVPNDAQDFTFTTTGGLTPDSFVLDDDGNSGNGTAKTRFFYAAPGTYGVSQASVPGFDLAALECSASGADTSTTETLASGLATINLGAGGLVTCTFTNTKRGTIHVIKNTVGGDGTFGFTSTFGLSTLTTTGGTASFTSAGLVPGAGYSVAETVPAGWDLTSAVCSSGTIDNVTVAPGQETTCTFTNTKRGTIRVVKNTIGGDGTFGFTSTFGLSTLTTSGGTASFTSASLVPGAEYSVSETVPAGWDLTSAVCSSGTPTSVTVSPGAETTCTFTNTKRGTIRVVKNTLGGNGTFDFTSTFGLSTLTTTAGTASFTSGTLLPGSGYSVSETVPAGWDQTSAVCSSGTTSNVIVAPGAETTCTFTNTKRGTIRVVKNTVGGDGTFPFTSSFGLTSLTTSAGTASFTSGNLQPGSGYSVSETVPAGWDQTSATCSSGTPANVTVSPGAETTCTFTNTKRGTIRVVKNTIGGNGTFGFTSTFGLSTLTTSAGTASFTSATLAPGSGYSVSETVPAGWDLTSAVCSSGTPANVTVAPGAETTCTFTNTKRGTIRVVKNTVGGDGTFPFTSTFGLTSLTTSAGTASFTSAALVPGSGYSVSETAPAGWDQTSATCSSGTPANVTVSPGAETTCTFTNTKRGTIRVVKNTIGGDGTFPFTSTFGLTSLTTSAGTASFTSAALVPGSGYTVSETVPAGWDLTSAVCSSGTAANVIVAPGAETTCTFTNTKRGTIRVVKNTVGGDGTFPFTSTFGLTSLTTSAGTASFTSASLVPGSGYSVSETVPAGWDLTSSSCSSGTTENVIVAPGQETTCTFTNTKRGTIRVVKNTVGGNGTFGFTSTFGLSTLTTSGGTASFTSAGLVPGSSYSISETAQPGWDLTSAVCSSGTTANVIVAPGAETTCTFTNTKRGTIRVVKNTVGGDGTFGFASTFGLTSLTTSAGTASFTSASLAPGSGYSVSETVPAGWDLSSAVCSSGTISNVIVAAGAETTCTFTNTKRGTIRVVKNTVGGDGTFGFTSTFGLTSLTTSSGTASFTSASLAPGSGYSVSETTVPAGWDLTSAVCSSGTIANVTVAPGAETTCTFTNTKRGTIRVVKNTLGGDGTFGFTSTFGLTSLTTSGGTASFTSASLAPGSGYSVSETVPAGWDLTSAVCSSGTAANMIVAPGAETTCTFTNTKRGTITIAKDTLPDHAQDFGFTGSGPAGYTFNGGFSLDDDGDPTLPSTRTFIDLVPGSYSVQETAVDGFDLTAIDCVATGTGSSATGTLGTGTTAITLGAGGAVTCTYRNRQRGTLTILQDTLPNDPQDFGYTGSGPGTFTFGGGFFLDDDSNPTLANTTTFGNVVPGTYILNEAAVGGFDTVAACVDPDGQSSTLGATATIDIDPGEVVTCTFTNTKRGALTIVKNTVGGDGTFPFTATGLTPGSFNLTTAGGTATQSFANLVPGGAYAVSEAVPAGWVQTSASCSDGSPLTAIGISPGEAVTCTFTNTKQATLVVEKHTIGNDGTFSFSTTGLTPASFNLTTSGGVASQSFTSLAPGSGYAVNETVPAGWSLTSASCSDGSPVNGITLSPGEVVTCSFTNTQRGTITIVKNTVGGDGSFAYTGTLGLTSLTTSGGTVTRTFGDLGPGTYTVAETNPAPAFDFTSLVCVDPTTNTVVTPATRSASIDLAAGETVTCTFTNTKRGAITIVKNTVGGDGTFAYTGTLGLTALSTTAGTASQTFSNLGPGNYTVAETDPAPSFDFTSLVCVDPTSNTVVTLGTRSANIALAAGESVTCTYTNTKRGAITIVKNTVGGDGSFSYTGTLGLTALSTTAGTASQTFSNLGPGVYTVAETNPAPAFDFTSLACVDPTTNTVVTLGTRSAAIDLAAGESVTCTFTNTKRGAITIVKNTIGGDGSFAYTGTLGLTSLNTTGGTVSQTFSNLGPGTYTVAETNPAPAFDFTNLVCVDPTSNTVVTLGTRSASIALGAGESVTCTFTNTKRGGITIVKNTVGGDGTFAYTGTLGLTTLTTTGGTVSQTFGNLAPGAYSVAETNPAPAFDFTSLACVDPTTNTVVTQGTRSAAIDLAAGESVTCTFTNTKRGGITIVKNTIGGDGTFAYTGTLGLTTLTTTGGTVSQTFSNLAPGAYTVAETNPAPAFDFTSLACVDPTTNTVVTLGTRSAAIDLAAGESVTCTFTNTKRGGITIVKNTIGGDGTFAYTGTLGLTTLTTTGGTVSQTFSNLGPGTYTVAETNPAPAFDFTTLACVDPTSNTAVTLGTRSASIDLAAGESVTCTFTNTKRGAITVVNNSVGGNASFAYTGTLGLTSLTTVGGTASQSFSNLAPGAYTVAQTDPAPVFDFTSLVCLDPTTNTAVTLGTRSAAIDLGAGETVTCTYTNTKRATLLVQKQTVGGDGTFPFTATGLAPASFNLTTSAGTATQSFANVAPGTGYVVSETVPAGWALTSATCSDGSPVTGIGLSPGEVVTCTFTNTKRGAITIVKNTVGGDGSFSYTGTLGLTALTTVGGTVSQTFSNLAPGSFTVAETDPAPAFDFTSLACVDPTTNTIVTPATRSAAIDLAAGETVTCTFTNTKRSALTIVKQTVGGDGTFAFTGNGLAPSSFSLTTSAGTATRSFANLVPGDTYAVTESATAGWGLTSASCSDGSPLTAIALSPGEEVTCTFTNTKQGSVTILNQVVGGDGTFAYTGTLGLTSQTTSGGTASQVFNLGPGSYTVSETDPAPAFDFTNLQCVDPTSNTVVTLATRTAAIDLAAGEAVTCTFTTTKRAALLVKKVTSAGNGTFGFTTTGLEPASFSLTTSAGIATQNFANLAPGGSYSVSETAQAGWTLTSASCSDDSPVTAIALSPGEVVTCTFTNTPQGSITIVKNTLGGDADFAFATVGLTPANFNLTTSGGTATQTFANLAPGGTYAVSEAAVPGWDLTSATCSDGSPVTAIALSPGESVTCTFTNVQRAAITIVKQAVGGDGTFAFTTTGLTPGSFNLTTSAGTATQGFANLIPGGTYAVSETAQPGWTLTSATCSDGSPVTAIALSPGEGVTCTFTNTKRATLVVEKHAVGGDGTFAFAATGLTPGNFNLTTIGGLATQTYTNLAPGASYAVREMSPVDITGLGTPIALITAPLGGGNHNIEVIRDGIFPAVGSNISVQQYDTWTGDASRPSDWIGYSYPSAHLFTGIDFQEGIQFWDGGWFTTLRVQVRSGGVWSDVSGFTSTPLYPGPNGIGYERFALAFTPVSGDAIRLIGTPGGSGHFISVGELRVSSDESGGQPSPGWDLTSATCSDGSPLTAIALSAGETVTCTFTNTKQAAPQPATLIVVKNTVGGDGTFGFTATGLALPSFNLTTTAGTATQTFASLTPGGSYSLSEAALTGWDLTSATCSDGSPLTSIGLSSGETVTCTFNNTKRGAVTIVKNTVGGDGTFGFTGTLGLSSLTTVGGTASQTFSNLVPGSYTVTETDPTPAFDFTNLVCVDPTSNTVVTLGTRSAAINVAAGETVTCTFTNTKPVPQLATIVVQKNTIGGEGTFSFTTTGLTPAAFNLTTSGATASQSFTNLAAGGSYSVSETPLAGWDLTSATCSDGSPVNAIALSAGETVTCTFTNTKRGAVTIVKNTVGGDGTFGFSGTLGLTSLTTIGGTASQTFSNVVPGSYSVAETDPTPAFDFTTLSCVDPTSNTVVTLGTRSAVIDVAAGETVTCTFVNSKPSAQPATIIVQKNTIGGEGTFSFTATGLTPAAFSLTTSGGTAAQTFAGLTPGGTYAVSETPAAGWDLLNATCSDGSPVTAVALSAGETVTCTFTNTKRATLVVEKRTVGGEGAFSFWTTGLSPATFNVTTSGGLATQSFANLLPGNSYAVREAVPAVDITAQATPIALIMAPLGGGNHNIEVIRDGVFPATGTGNSAQQYDTWTGDPTRATDWIGYSFPSTHKFTGLDFEEGIQFGDGGWFTTLRVQVRSGGVWSDVSGLVSAPAYPGANGISYERFALSFTPVVGDGIRIFGTPGGSGRFISVGELRVKADDSGQPVPVLPPGWELTSATCSDGSPVTAIALSAGETVTCTFTNTRPGATGGLVAAYSFNQGSGGTLSDSSGRGNNGVITGATWTNTGRFGNALSFTGTNTDSWVQVNQSPSLDLGAAMTLEAWVWPTSLVGWRPVIYKESAEWGLVWALYASDKSAPPSAYATTSGGADQWIHALGPVMIPINAWTHLAATYDGTNLKLYVNGVLERTTPRTGLIFNSTSPLYIAGHGSQFVGQIDEVRIYNRALTAGEIVTDRDTPVP